MELKEFLDSIYLGERDVTAATEQHYRISIATFESWLGRPAMLADLTSSNFNAYIKHLQQHTSLSPDTVRSKRADILVLWRFAWENRYIDEHPRGIRRIKLHDKIPCSWSPLEMKRLLSHTSDFTLYLPNGVQEGPLLNAFARLTYDTGVRLGDALGLPWSHVDQETGSFHIVQQKSGQLHRCKVRDTTLDALQAIPHPDDRAIPWPYGRAALWDRWRRLLLAAGLPTGRRQGPQKLRRTSATELAREYGPEAASQHLGHSRHSIGLAQKNYLADRAYKEPPLPPEVA